MRSVRCGYCCAELLLLCAAAIVAGNGAFLPTNARFPVQLYFGEGDDVPLNQEEQRVRIDFLEQHLARTLQTVVQKRRSPVFTTALIAGDAVLLDAIAKAGLLRRIPIVLVDTLHLFPETLEFLRQVEEHYNFRAEVYRPLGCETREQLAEKHGTHELWRDTARYDRICKVEPLQRALAKHHADAWITGRRRDQSAERSRLLVWEQNKVNPLAHWTFEDCWAYLQRHRVPYHPLHDRGYPSIGDVHSTAPVERTRWLEYGAERSGRFQGMRNADGTLKTECGIHKPTTAATTQQSNS